MGEERGGGEEQDRGRDPGDRGEAEAAHLLGEVELARGGEEGTEAAEDEERGEGDDEGDHAEAHDEEGVDRAHQRRGEHGDDEPAGDAEAEFAHRDAGDQRGEIHHRADREVDAGGQEHEDHADRGDADEGGVLDDVAEVVGAEEARRLQAEIDQHRGEDQHGGVAEREGQGLFGQGLAGHASSSRKALARMRSVSKRSRSNSPTISPRLITRMRSHMPVSSSSSEEMKRMPLPEAARRSASA